MAAPALKSRPASPKLTFVAEKDRFDGRSSTTNDTRSPPHRNRIRNAQSALPYLPTNLLLPEHAIVEEDSEEEEFEEEEPEKEEVEEEQKVDESDSISSSLSTDTVTSDEGNQNVRK